MIKLLIGGSPCTYWSIAQKQNRETQAEGLGWELFKNYLIAKEKFKPDFFLYENNKSAATAIKDQIKKELKVWDGTLLMEDTGARYIEINSALVSAQNRQRFYVHNCGEVEQPEDRGILLKDILESGVGQRQQDKSRTLTAGYVICSQRDMRMDIETNGFMGKQGVIEPIPVNTTADGKAGAIRATCYKDTVRNLVGNDYDRRTCVAEPVGQTFDGKAFCLTASYDGNEGIIAYGKAQTITTGSSARQLNVLIQDAESGAEIIKNEKPKKLINQVYEVKDGFITIKDKQYPIKLADGYYIIRKLTVTECARLQTMPDNYCRAVSNSHAYKGLGNGWTAEVIIHLLNGALKNVPRDEELVVLSMYDGIGTGRYCLDKMGFTNVKYYAYEIDKYAMQVALSNYPDIIQCGDAFAVRNEKLGGRMQWLKS